MHQVPMILGVIIHQVVLFFTSKDSIVLWVSSLFALTMTIISLYAIYHFGEINFAKLTLNGNYEVGFKEFRTSKFDNEVSVFYPIEKKHHA